MKNLVPPILLAVLVSSVKLPTIIELIAWIVILGLFVRVIVLDEVSKKKS